MKSVTMKSDLDRIIMKPGVVRSLIIFIVVTFGFSWLLLAIIAMSGMGVMPFKVSSPVMTTIATLGPALGAVSAAASKSGRSGIRSLLGQALRWRVASRWYLLALFGPAFIMIAGFLLWQLLGGMRPPAPPLSTWLSLPVLILVLLLPAVFEEIGWRGYALPRLQSRFGWLAASMMIGVVWAIFHAPIWFIPDGGFSTLPFPVFALFTMALSVLFSWLYNHCGGSVLLPALAHAAIDAYPLPWNTAVFLLPESERGMYMQIPVMIVLVVLTVLLVLLTWGQKLQK